LQECHLVPIHRIEHDKQQSVPNLEHLIPIHTLYRDLIASASSPNGTDIIPMAMADQRLNNVV
jgi:hypothetical protein